MSEHVLYSVADGVATLTLNRPASLNAVSPEMMSALLAGISRAAGDRAARAVLLCAAGEHFMAGGDLRWFHARTDLPESEARPAFTALLDDVQASVLALQRLDKPVVGAVQGAVAGFGLSLMLACDLVVAAEDAYFTLAYSNIALSPDGGATWALPRQVGLKQAMEIMLLGDRFDAARARELGLVNRVVPRPALGEAAGALAARLAAGPARALARSKALLLAAGQHSLAEQLAAEQESFVACALEPDFRTGLDAFFARRKPVYPVD